MLSTIIFIITRGWHNRPGVAADSPDKKKISQVRILVKAGGGNFIFVLFDNTYSIILFINYTQ
jgi:hypothetical protein